MHSFVVKLDGSNRHQRMTSGAFVICVIRLVKSTPRAASQSVIQFREVISVFLKSEKNVNERYHDSTSKGISFKFFAGICWRCCCCCCCCCCNSWPRYSVRALHRITLGRHKSDNSNQMTQLSGVLCLPFICYRINIIWW